MAFERKPTNTAIALYEGGVMVAYIPAGMITGEHESDHAQAVIKGSFLGGVKRTGKEDMVIELWQSEAQIERTILLLQEMLTTLREARKERS